MSVIAPPGDERASLSSTTWAFGQSFEAKCRPHSSEAVITATPDQDPRAIRVALADPFNEHSRQSMATACVIDAQMGQAHIAARDPEQRVCDQSRLLFRGQETALRRCVLVRGKG